MSYEFKGKKSNTLQDVLGMVIIIILFVLNPIYSLVSQDMALIIGIASLLGYIFLGNIKTIGKTWKNNELAKFFDAFNNPSQGELILGIALIIFGNIALKTLGFDFPDILTSIFFVFYILRTVLKSSRGN